MVSRERKKAARLEKLQMLRSMANSHAQVTVETLENGFLINVFSEKSCPGLLVSLLEVFEELQLNVLQARVSCTENFQLEAVGEEAISGSISAQVVKQSVVQAINTWMESNGQDE